MIINILPVEFYVWPSAYRCDLKRFLGDSGGTNPPPPLCPRRLRLTAPSPHGSVNIDSSLNTYRSYDKDERRTANDERHVLTYTPKNVQTHIQNIYRNISKVLGRNGSFK